MSESALHAAQQRAVSEAAPARSHGAHSKAAALREPAAAATGIDWRFAAESGAGAILPSGVAAARRRAALLGLQRTVGNAAVQRFLASAPSRPPPPTASSPIGLVQRQPEPTPDQPLQHQETGIVVEPGALKPGVLGASVPLPSSLEMRKPPGSGRGRWLTAPSFMLKIDPRGMVGGILDTVDLGGFQLINPTVTFNPKSDTLTGVATVSIPDTKYPAHLVSPTDVEVRVTSSAPGKFKAEADYGPFVADFTLTLAYDTAPIEQILKAIRGGDLATGLGKLDEVPTTGSFSARGRLGVGTRKYSLPLTVAGVSGEAGPGGVAWKGGAAGAIAVPAGTFHPELTAPGAGGVYSSGHQERSGAGSQTSAIAAVTGTPSIAALTKGDFGGAFKPFLFAQITHATKTAKGHTLGIRLSAHYRLGGGSGAIDPLDQAHEQQQQDRYRLGGDAANRPSIDPAVTNKWADMTAGGRDEQWRGGVEVFGTFDLLGGK